MKTIELDIDQVKAPISYSELLEQQDIQQGDHLKLLTELEPDHFAVLAILVFLIFNKKRKQKQSFGEELLEELFKEFTSVKEAETTIKKEYGIEVTVEQKDPEREAWVKGGMKAFAKGYGEDEPDYSLEDIKEPNPAYKPWKKER